MLTFSSNNFIEIKKEIRVTTGADIMFNANLSPEITSSSAIRIVLSWNETPVDLDAHLLTPTIGDYYYHIFWNNPGSETEPPYAALDVDETEGFGPETITIHNPQTGTYNYWVHNWSDDAPLAGSGAVVEVYDSNGLLNRFTAPGSGEQDYWHVFNVVGSTGEIQTVNQMVDVSPGADMSSYHIVLTWAEEPADLDAHLLTPSVEGQEYHIYSGNLGASDRPPYVTLNEDVQTGYGPEIISIHSLTSGTYTYYVENISGEPSLTNSEAFITVWDGNVIMLIGALNVPTSGDGRYWYAFDIDGSTGDFVIVNEITNVPPGGGGGGLAAPSNLRAETVSGTEIYLYWSDNSDDEDGFEIEYKVGSGSWDNLGELEANQNSCRVYNLQPSTTYYFRVRAFNDDGYSDYSNTASATTLDAIFTDSFDDDPLNQPPDDESWGYGYDGTSRLYVTDEKSYPSGGRCVKFIDPDEGDDNMIILRGEHTPITEGTLSMYLYISQRGYLGICGFEDANPVSRSDDATFFLQFLDDGRFLAIDGGELLNTVILDPYPIGQWIHLEIDADIDNSTYDIRIDGDLKAGNLQFYNNNSFPSMAVFDIMCFNDATMNEAYLDAVMLSGEVVDPGRAISCGVPSVEPDGVGLKRSPTISGWNR